MCPQTTMCLWQQTIHVLVSQFPKSISERKNYSYSNGKLVKTSTWNRKKVSKKHKKQEQEDKKNEAKRGEKE